MLHLRLCDEILESMIMGLVKHFDNYISAIVFAAMLLLAWYFAQLPFNIWLPGVEFLPEWMQDRSALMLVSTYYVFILIPAFIVGTAIFYFRVLKKL